MSTEARALTLATRRFYGQVSNWTAARWAARDSAGVSRADLAFALVESVAALAVAAEGLSARRVPRLENDLAIGDQLRVVVADLVAAAPSPAVLAHAVSLVEHAQAALAFSPVDQEGHRRGIV